MCEGQVEVEAEMEVEGGEVEVERGQVEVWVQRHNSLVTR